ncbi:uncharacterized mitochondrial protein AtMg00810-like [Macadamia integrifolia]|uniref:uncharacterized mitochondrial protein AtMg00810-like n=1 Tax=Macadamia integrifolia TaxID=60698 RepID=UPI001C4EEC95|nr:uncharacterized mitochondrial protein AtMg00810-like [Macadamia integrifolia]
MVDQVIASLGKEFAIRDLGNLHYFVGIEVMYHPQGIILSQQRYIMDLLKRIGMDGAKPVHNPMSSSTKLSRNCGTPMTEPSLYRSAVGALQYATLTRPNISFSVNKVCQFLHSPTEEHWQAIKRILRYLKDTVAHGLLISKTTSQRLMAFSDANWAGCIDDHRYTGGFAIFIGTNLISWSAKKQPTISRSSTESEYQALANTTAELV